MRVPAHINGRLDRLKMNIHCVLDMRGIASSHGDRHGDAGSLTIAKDKSVSFDKARFSQSQASVSVIMVRVCTRKVDGELRPSQLQRSGHSLLKCFEIGFIISPVIQGHIKITLLFTGGKGVPPWKGKDEMVGVEDLHRRTSILARVRRSR